MKKQSKVKPTETIKSVDKQELNLWKRGFTPQAEIWNGRMATIGIGIILVNFILCNSLKRFLYLISEKG